MIKFSEMTTFEIIIQIVGFVAMGIFFLSSFLKSKKKMLATQCPAHVLLMVTEYVNGPKSSIVQEFISITRNVVTILGKNKKAFDIIIVTIGTVIGILFNFLFDGGLLKNHYLAYNSLKFWIGFLPVIANLEYSICIVSPKVSERNLKLSLCISNLLWGSTFIICGNYLSGTINCICGIAAFISYLTFNLKVSNVKPLENDKNLTNDNEIGA